MVAIRARVFLASPGSPRIDDLPLLQHLLDHRDLAADEEDVGQVNLVRLSAGRPDNQVS